MDLFSLDNKSLLLVGATSDIGRATALVCAKSCKRLILTGRCLPVIEEMARELAASSDTEVLTAVCDLLNSEDISSLVCGLPVLDGVVVAAGTLETLPCKMLDSESISRIMSVNFNAIVMLISALLKNKKINRGASIVFISSVGGNILAEKGNALYGASKAALSAYARTLALELSGRKIRVNCVMPGMVRTKFLDNFSLDEEDFVADEKRYPLGYGTPEDVASGIVYLLSDATRWITGTELLMDGGRTLQ